MRSLSPYGPRAPQPQAATGGLDWPALHFPMSNNTYQQRQHAFLSVYVLVHCLLFSDRSPCQYKDINPSFFGVKTPCFTMSRHRSRGLLRIIQQIGPLACWPATASFAFRTGMECTIPGYFISAKCRLRSRFLNLSKKAQHVMTDYAPFRPAGGVPKSMSTLTEAFAGKLFPGCKLDDAKNAFEKT